MVFTSRFTFETFLFFGFKLENIQGYIHKVGYFINELSICGFNKNMFCQGFKELLPAQM